VKKRTLIIEFFGLPGVGKSALSNRISEILFEEYDLFVKQGAYNLSHEMGRFRRMLVKLFYVMKELIFHPHYSIASIKAIIRTQQRTIKDLIKVIFNWLFVSSLLRSSRNGFGVKIFDEGIFQALWSIGFSGNDESLTIMQPILAMAPLPEILVVPEANLDIITSRIAKRPKHDSRLENGSKEKLDNANSLFKKIKKILISLFEERHQMHFFNVKNNREKDLEINAQKIAIEIGGFLN
jgi:thymidylate kinase